MRFFTHSMRIGVLTLALSSLLGVGAAAVGTATVAEGPLRLRAEANTASAILATAPVGAQAQLLDSGSHGWYRISYEGREGYMFGEHLLISLQGTEASDETAAPADDVSAETYVQVAVDGSLLNLRAWAGTDYTVLARIPDRTILTVEGTEGDWYKVTYLGHTGYISGEYAAPCDKPVYSATLGGEIVAFAQQFLGRKYVYGAAGPNTFDCSGLTSYVYKQYGYSLQRSAVGQLQNGVPVSKGELQPGDLVFFKYRTTKAASHVGLYIGGGEFIHASTTGYVVKINDLTTGHYSNVFVGGRRIV